MCQRNIMLQANNKLLFWPQCPTYSTPPPRGSQALKMDVCVEFMPESKNRLKKDKVSHQ